MTRRVLSPNKFPDVGILQRGAPCNPLKPHHPIDGRGPALRQESGPAPPAPHLELVLFGSRQSSVVNRATALTWRASVSAEKTVRPWLDMSRSRKPGDQAVPVFGARPSPLRQQGTFISRLSDRRLTTSVHTSTVGGRRSRITFAGTPAAMWKGGISPMTTAPAPMIASRPTRDPSDTTT